MLPIVQQQSIESILEAADRVNDSSSKRSKGFGTAKDNAGGKKDSGKGKTASISRKHEAILAREGRLVPTLVYYIEALEREILALPPGASGGVSLAHLRRSTARDFRIQTDRLVALRLANADADEGNGMDDEDASEEEGEGVSATSLVLSSTR
jgi:hypothetical protein